MCDCVCVRVCACVEISSQCIWKCCTSQHISEEKYAVMVCWYVRVWCCVCVCVGTWMQILCEVPPLPFPCGFLSSQCFLVSSPSGCSSIFIHPGMTPPLPHPPHSAIFSSPVEDALPLLLYNIFYAYLATNFNEIYIGEYQSWVSTRFKCTLTWCL